MPRISNIRAGASPVTNVRVARPTNQGGGPMKEELVTRVSTRGRLHMTYTRANN